MNDTNSSETGSTVQDNTKAIKIGLWGGPGSGKTHYIAMLYRDIRDRSGQGIRIEELPADDAHEHDPYDMDNITKGEAWDSAAQNGQIFIRERNWLPRTQYTTERFPTYRFRIYHRQGSGGDNRDNKANKSPTQQLLFTVTDAPGEWYRNPRSAIRSRHAKLKNEGIKNPIELLQESEGIICLFDPDVALKGTVVDLADTRSEANEQDPENRPLTRDELAPAFRELSGFLKATKQGSDGTIAQPLAICLSKIDRVGLWSRRNDPAKLEEWANSYLPDLMKEIRNVCQAGSYKWFGISVVGCINNAHNEPISPVDEENNIIEGASITPFNLFEPIAWLASKIAENERDRAKNATRT